MKRPAVAVCDRRTFKQLDRGLHDFVQELRAALREAVVACGTADIVGDDAQAVRMWAITLGPLMYDVSASVLLLLSHGHRRAPIILNRSIFEYQVRLRYYAMRPDKARQALDQLGERFKKIMRADPTWKDGRTEENRIETEKWLSETQKLAHESIKDDLFKTVFGDDWLTYYDGFYGKASSLVHGYETILRDVHRDAMVGEENPQPDLKGKVWEPNDTCAVLVYALFDGLEAMVDVAGDKKQLATLKGRWDALRAQLQAVLS